MSKSIVRAVSSAHSIAAPRQFSKNRELQVLLDAMRAIIFYLDRSGVVQYANIQAQSWYGKSGLFGEDIFELMPYWKNAKIWRNEFVRVIETGEPIRNSLEQLTINDEDSWYRVDKIPTTDGVNTVTGILLIMHECTDSMIKEKEIKQSEDRYRAFISNSADAIWCYEVFPPIDISLPEDVQVDLILQRATLVEANERLAKIVGAKSARDIINLPLHRNGSLSNKENITAFVRSGYNLDDQEYARITQNGEKLIMQSSAMGSTENGFLMRAWGTTRDITERKIHLEKLEYLANHDALTSLPNRSLLFKVMNDAFKKNQAYSSMALLLIDLDRFKEINDTLGHLAGDRVLKQLGPRLEVELGDTPGLVARLGGDEFAIFLPKIRNRQHGVVMAHRFLDSICQVFEVEGFKTEISASIGVAMAPDNAQDAITLLRYADVAMYNAKSRFKGVSIYDSAFDSHTPKRLELMGALGSAIREGQLFLQYQPKVDLQNNKTFGFEALIRWNHPTMGFIPPSEFVPIAEMSSFIYAMSSWVLEETIRQCAHWVEQGRDIVCAMNLSARNLVDDRIVMDLAKFLDKYKLPGRCLELEITESMLMSDPERAQLALEKMAALGVSLAIDDFGTGYSSLAYLKRLPVKTLKIDGSFIRGMLEDEQDEIIVHSTIQLAHNLGLAVVAECVEDKATYDRLRELGCDNVQGYYVSRPINVGEVTSWLDGSSWW